MTEEYSMVEKIQALVEDLDDYINHYHGGSVHFESYQNGIVKVRLGGACAGCPMSSATVHGWVEGTLRQFFPEIKGVEEV